MREERRGTTMNSSSNGRRNLREAYSLESDDDDRVLDSISDEEGVSAATAIHRVAKVPRLSNVSFQAGAFDKSNIVQPLNQMKEILMNLLQRLKTNREDISDNVLVVWKNRILEITKKIISIQLQYHHMDTITNNYLNSYLEKESEQQQGENDSSSVVSAKIPNVTLLVKEINQMIDEEMKKLNVLEDEYYKKVEQICRKIANHGKDTDELEEDLEILDDGEELTEATFKCPYTQTRIKEPYKNCNPNLTQACIHVLSKEAIQGMFHKRTSSNCPVAGCNGKWLKNHVAIDEQFLLKLKRFEKQQSLRSQILGEFASQSRSHTHTISLDDD